MTHSIKSRFKTPSNEELEAQAMVNLTGLNHSTSKIVFSYLFDVNKAFGLRFPVLMDRSEKSFQIASTKMHSSKIDTRKGEKREHLCYPREGREEYLLYNGPVKKASPLFLEHIVSQDADRPYLHLDIGGASGDFAFALENAGKKMGYSVEGHTVSASDLRAKHSQVSDDRYHIYNASDILAYEPIASRSWNSIVCITTMVYLEDNARNLADFYELLAPGGLLIVQGAYFLGIQEGPQEMLEFLNEMGYAVIAFYTSEDILSHRIATLILQKSHAHLNFPIIYDMDEPYIEEHTKFRALYSLDPRFMTMGDTEARQKQISHIVKKNSRTFYFLEVPKSVFPKTHPLTQLYERALKRQ